MSTSPVAAAAGVDSPKKSPLTPHQQIVAAISSLEVTLLTTEGTQLTEEVLGHAVIQESLCFSIHRLLWAKEDKHIVVHVMNRDNTLGPSPRNYEEFKEIFIIKSRENDRVVSQLDGIASLESMVELTSCAATAKITKLEIELEAKLVLLMDDYETDCAEIVRKFETPNPAEGSVDGEGAPATPPSVEFMREDAEAVSVKMQDDLQFRASKLKDRQASILRSHEASVAVITSESAVQCGKQRTSAPFATIEKLLKTVWQGSWEALYKDLQGFFPIAVWLRLEDGAGEVDNSYDKVLIIMSALQELRQFSTFSAQVNKLVLTVGPHRTPRAAGNLPGGGEPRFQEAACLPRDLQIGREHGFLPAPRGNAT